MLSTIPKYPYKIILLNNNYLHLSQVLPHNCIWTLKYNIFLAFSYTYYATWSRALCLMLWISWFSKNLLLSLWWYASNLPDRFTNKNECHVFVYYSSGGRYGFGDRVVDGMYLQINVVVIDFKSNAFKASLNVSCSSLLHSQWPVQTLTWM